MSEYESFDAYGSLSTDQSPSIGGVGSSVLGKGVRATVKNNIQQEQQAPQQQLFSKGKFIIDFYGSWCGPCKKIAPFFEQLEKSTPGVTFVKVDIQENQELAMSMGVQSVPTFMAIKNGALVDKLVGADPNKLKALVNKINSIN